jgi:ABC-2 type transport system ATP-binding protein
VQVRTPHTISLMPLLKAEGAAVSLTEIDLMSVRGLVAPRIAEIAAGSGIVIHELTPVKRSLEDAYMELTRDDVEYRTERTPAEAGR